MLPMHFSSVMGDFDFHAFFRLGAPKAGVRLPFGRTIASVSMSIVSPLQSRFTIRPCAAMVPHPAASRDSGRIEPLPVTAADGRSRKYTLLDGYLRLVALRELGRAEAMCLVATDDEAYTYNNRLNRLASVQEHLMIRRAIERGVPPLRLAKALDVKIDQIVAKVTLLDGLCPEAIALLKAGVHQIMVDTKVDQRWDERAADGAHKRPNSIHATPDGETIAWANPLPRALNVDVCGRGKQ